MGLYKYSQPVAEKESAAQAFDLNASYKDLSQVCSAIKGKSVSEAKKILEEVISLKKPVAYKKFSKGTAHRPQLKGRKGKFPKKEARALLEVLANAVANAANKGLDEKKLFVKHAAAYKQNVLRRYRKYWAGGNTLGYGKQAVWSNYTTARAEVILREKE